MPATEVSNPRRVLAVSLEGAAGELSRVVKDLTGSPPQPASTSLAGTTHNLALKTAYYTATIPIWLDLIAAPSAWASSFLSDEASEVLAVLGGLVLVFPVPGSTASSVSGATAADAADAVTADEVRELIEHVGRVVDTGLGGWEWDGVRLAVGVGDGDADEWDELCAEGGMEFVQVGGRDTGRNEFGEKTGIARVKEALESNDWAQLDDDALSEFGDFEAADCPESGAGKDEDEELEPEKLDFGYDPADFEGLRRAIWTSGIANPDDKDEATTATSTGATEGLTNISIKTTDGNPQHSMPALSEKSAEKTEAGNTLQEDDPGADGGVAGLDDNDLVKVEQMMRKLQAVREAGEGMGEAQRRRLAARAVEEVMKEL